MTAPGRSPDRLFELMPALHRILDEEQGHVLGGLLRLVNEHADLLRDDVERLWDDFFIETCQRWVVPYIGDLVGNIPLLDPDMTAAAATGRGAVHRPHRAQPGRTRPDPGPRRRRPHHPLPAPQGHPSHARGAGPAT